jgi:hypothetical protein
MPTRAADNSAAIDLVEQPSIAETTAAEFIVDASQV